MEVLYSGLRLVLQRADGFMTFGVALELAGGSGSGLGGDGGERGRSCWAGNLGNTGGLGSPGRGSIFLILITLHIE